MERVAVGGDLVEVVGEEGDGALLRGLEEHKESVPLGGWILFRQQHFLHQLRPIGEQVLKRAEDGKHSEHGIAPHEGVTVLQILLDGGHERLEDLGLLELAEEAKRAAANVLVRVHQVVAQPVGDEDHLWHQLAVWPHLLDDLPVDEQQLFYLVVVARHAEADHSHEQPGHHLAVQQQRDQRL